MSKEHGKRESGRNSAPFYTNLQALNQVMRVLTLEENANRTDERGLTDSASGDCAWMTGNAEVIPLAW
jgi:hypothetical protein